MLEIIYELRYLQFSCVVMDGQWNRVNLSVSVLALSISQLLVSVSQILLYCPSQNSST